MSLFREACSHGTCSGQEPLLCASLKSHLGSLQDKEFRGRQLDFKMNLFIHPIQLDGLFYKRAQGNGVVTGAGKQNQGRFWMMTLKSPTASPEGGMSRGKSLCRLGSGVQLQEGPSPTGSGKQSTGLRGGWAGGGLGMGS